MTTQNKRKDMKQTREYRRSKRIMQRIEQEYSQGNRVVGVILDQTSQVPKVTLSSNGIYFSGGTTCVATKTYKDGRLMPLMEFDGGGTQIIGGKWICDLAVQMYESKTLWSKLKFCWKYLKTEI